MSGIFDKFRKTVIHSIWKQPQDVPEDKGIDDLIALGVLLWEVADADQKFLPQEEEKLRDVLRSYAKISDEDMPIVLRAIEEASFEKIDLYAFTREVGADLEFKVKVEILEQLFCVACADNDLDQAEHELIRKIANLLKLDHKDFIDAKIKVKKQFGMDTAGL